MIRHERRSLVLMAVLLTFFALVIVRNAWLADDAYIGLRTVDNLVHGQGLTWNVGERVQTFTCPLWILLHCAVYAVTREAYYTSICVSVLVSLLTLACVCAALERHAGVVRLDRARRLQGVRGLFDLGPGKSAYSSAPGPVSSLFS